MTKLRDMGWKDRDRNSQLANAIWPHLSDPETRKQMLARAAEDGGRGKAGLEKRIDQGLRDYGKAKPNLRGAFDMVPGLKRVEAPKGETKPWWK